MISETELIKLFEQHNKEVLPIVKPMIHRLVTISNYLDELEIGNLENTSPFLIIHPKNPNIQKRTDSGKMYDRYISHEREIASKLCSYIHKGGEGESESPLRLYLQTMERRG